MRRFVDLLQVSRLDSLIRRQATGTPDQLAERLGMSRSSLFDIIAFLREEMRAPIRYNRDRPSYVYEYTPKFYLGFERDRMTSAEKYAAWGGTEKNDDSVEFLSDDDVIIEDDFYTDEF